jgi:hypothetical protein
MKGKPLVWMLKAVCPPLKAALVALPFAGLLIVGLWANCQGWWQAACIVAFVEVLALYGMRLNEENKRRAGERGNADLSRGGT